MRGLIYRAYKINTTTHEDYMSSASSQAVVIANVSRNLTSDIYIFFSDLCSLAAFTPSAWRLCQTGAEKWWGWDDITKLTLNDSVALRCRAVCRINANI